MSINITFYVFPMINAHRKLQVVDDKHIIFFHWLKFTGNQECSSRLWMINSLSFFNWRFSGNRDCSSRLCKKELYQLYKKVDNFRQQKMITILYSRGQSVTYNDAKMLARQYQDSKERLFNVFRKKGYGNWKRHYNVHMFS